MGLQNGTGSKGKAVEVSGEWTNSSNFSLEDLPLEIVSQILSHLSLEDLLVVSTLSRKLRLLLADPLLTPYTKPISDILDNPFYSWKVAYESVRNGTQNTPDAGQHGQPSPGPANLERHLSRETYSESLRTLALRTYPRPPIRPLMDVLVRASPLWILEEMEIPHLKEVEWEEVCRRRFLKGWLNGRREDEKWRAFYMRTIRRLAHRRAGCTHDEAWTKFLILHRNGSASLNRIYSRTFDPYQIFREVKHQNNLASEPTQVRVVCQLQDVRILAFGVLHSPQSFHINANAHALLHPPLLRCPSLEDGSWPGFLTLQDGSSGVHQQKANGEIKSFSYEDPHSGFMLSGGASAARGSTGPRASRVPLDRADTEPESQDDFLNLSLTRSLEEQDARQRRQHQGVGETSSQRPRANSSFTSAFASILRGSSANSTSNNQAAASSSSFSTSPGAAEGIHRFGRWKRGRGESFSGDASANSARQANSAPTRTGWLQRVRSRDPDATAGTPPNGMTIPEEPTRDIGITHEDTGYSQSNGRPSESPRYHSIIISRDPISRSALPYRPLKFPEPAPSHRLYPNFTPPPIPATDEALRDAVTKGLVDSGLAREMIPAVFLQRNNGNVDWRSRIVVTREPRVFYKGGLRDEGVGEVDCEWDDRLGEPKAWVGPMLLIAQLYPATQIPTSLQHPLASRVNDANGTQMKVDIGPTGTYASLDWDDLEDLAPWLDLRAEDGDEGPASGMRRDGMGFGA